MSSRLRNASFQEWGQSSGDDYNNHQRKMQLPAQSTDEAMWRAAKRFGSAWRWLKIDLALSAEDKHHHELFNSMETTLKLLGDSLLPDLGVRPLSRDLLARPDVIDFVSILNAIPRSSESPKLEETEHHMQLEEKATATTKAKPGLKNCSVQAFSDYMVRDCFEELSGEWVPLDAVSTRRGAIARCTACVATNNAEGVNLTTQNGDIFKIVEIDSDGDFRIAVLEDAGVAQLRFPSYRYWLLERDCVGKVEAWLPEMALSNTAASKRESRNTACEMADG